jgi:hypothetical protein
LRAESANVEEKITATLNEFTLFQGRAVTGPWKAVDFTARLKPYTVRV